MIEPYNETGISLSPGEFKAAVEFMDRGPINVSVDETGLCFKNGKKGSRMVYEAVPYITAFKDAHWTVSQELLMDLAALIPSDTIFWERRKLDLEFEIDRYETHVGNIQVSLNLNDHDRQYAYQRAQDKLWAKDPEYRSLRRLEEDAKAHVYDFGAFFYPDKIEFYLSVNSIADVAWLTVPSIPAPKEVTKA